MPIGSIVNALAILAGGGLGLVLGRRYPERIRAIVFQALSLGVVVIGLSMALGFERPLILVFSLIIGGIIGEWLDLDERFNRFGDWLKSRIKSENELFTQGLVTASLIYCVGSMAIIGAFDEGLRGDPTILLTKSVLDGFTSIALASTHGLGVLLAAVPVFVYQVGLTIFAGWFKEYFSPVLINELTAVGGVLILGIGLNLLDVARIKISNLLPALVVVVGLVWIV